MRIDFKTGTFYLGDCFEVMAELAAGSVDMVLNDPPYGTTACAWDSVLPLAPMWSEYWRLLKANGAAVLTASQPFTTTLIASQIDRFKYEWIWGKSRATGHVHARNKPMKEHENVLIFSEGTTVHATQSVNRMPYHPQGLVTLEQAKIRKKGGATDAVMGARPSHRDTLQTESNFPTSIIPVASEGSTFHPTQKPVALFEYLIRTYTNSNELVLDNTAGSGTTAIAAMQSGRRWVCIERDEDYFAKAIARVWDAEALLAP